jgi:hypothetical protein
MTTNETIKIGQTVQQRLTAEGRTATWLCREMGWQRAKWYRFCKTGQITVHDLYRISKLMKHNFFQDCVTLFDDCLKDCNK